MFYQSASQAISYVPGWELQWVAEFSRCWPPVLPLDGYPVGTRAVMELAGYSAVSVP